MTDPLNVNVQLGDVDTSFPVIPEGDYQLQLVESRVQPDYEKTGLEWSPVFVTTEPLTSVDNRPVPPGTKLFCKYSFGLQERTDGQHPGMWKQSLALAAEALFPNVPKAERVFNQEFVNNAVGKIVVGRVIIDEGKDGIKRNKVKSFRAVKEETATA